MSELKLDPCKYCGDTELDGGKPFPSENNWYIRCGNPYCGIEACSSTRDGVIGIWNRRAPSAEQAAAGSQFDVLAMSRKYDTPAAEQQQQEPAGNIKRICVDFFRWWYNKPGANTDQGFDEWWQENAALYTHQQPQAHNVNVLAKLVSEVIKRGEPVSLSAEETEEFHRRFLEEWEQPQAQGDWQPIETAPKDGSEVLLKVKARAGIKGKCLVGHYMPGGHCIEDHPPIDAGWYFWNGCMFDIAAEPTHWKPLDDQQPRAAVPDGFVLLPRQVTKEMYKAALEKDVWPLTGASFERLYAALIEAAQPQPVDAQGGEG